MEKGSKPWNRSKVMLLGEGRVGKTALSNSMMGKPFQETESTVGLTKLTCDVQKTSANNGRWSVFEKPQEKEFETGVAQVIKEMESKQLVKKKQSSQQTVSRQINSQTLKPTDAKKQLDTVTTSRNLASQLKSGSEVAQPLKALDEINDNTINTDVGGIEPDQESVMKYLKDVRVEGSDLILSFFDFGGQSVFNIIHHLFLTSYGVYVVAFNMLDMLKNIEKCLAELSFWINSFVMHTGDSERSQTAPVFIVGTHKDKVNDRAKHIDISNILEQRFGHNRIVWPRVVLNEEDLFFFPVDNRNSQQDGVIRNLMSKIENSVKLSDYVKQPRPLFWLKVLDELMAADKSSFAFNEALSIAIANGVKESDVRYLLKFLNEMGVVLWLNEEGLRDVVILDIISFFIEPATLIICNHIAKPSDETIHHRKIQKRCKQNFMSEWEEMIERGVVARELINFLWADHVKADNIPVILSIMLKFGLIVRLEPSQESGRSTEKYLVPALLPCTKGDPRTFIDDLWNKLTFFETCYFVFSTASDFSTNQALTYKQLRDECFLPRGLMERLIAKAVKWSTLKDIANVHCSRKLYSNYAALCYGSQMFRIIYIPELNCIRLDIEGLHPLPVYNEVSKLIDICVKECMGSLQFITALTYGSIPDTEDGFVTLNLSSLRGLQSNEQLRFNGRHLDFDSINNMYGSWLIKKDLTPPYDIFISHRWNSHDNKVIDELCDGFRDHVVGPAKRAAKVFLDKTILKEGQQFQDEYGKALVNSTILVPIVSADALQKLTYHNTKEEDNVLIEWMLALECMKDQPHSKIRAIYPLLFGTRTADGSVGDLFAEGIIDKLPDIVPTASIEIAKTLLGANGVAESSFLSECTVRSVANKFSKNLGDKGWENFSARKSSDKIIDILNKGMLMYLIFSI